MVNRRRVERTLVLTSHAITQYVVELLFHSSSTGISIASSSRPPANASASEERGLPMGKKMSIGAKVVFLLKNGGRAKVVASVRKKR